MCYALPLTPHSFILIEQIIAQQMTRTRAMQLFPVTKRDRGKINSYLFVSFSLMALLLFIPSPPAAAQLQRLLLDAC